MRWLFAMFLALPMAWGAKTLDIYVIDVEGGQATLIVTPNKQTLLVDCGWPGFGGRDASRIAAAAKKAGIKKIDYLMTTHFHRDHVGGVNQLLEKLPVATFVDHGDNIETDKGAQELNNAYQKALGSGKRMSVKPGDSIPLKGVQADIITANGQMISSQGAANPLCGKEPRRAEDPTENARSTGVLLTFGKFRFIDLGDLTWNKELDLMCPSARVAPVDVYLTTHHGMNMSGPAAIVHALRPRVALMNNGARKGGTPEAFQVVKSSPGLEDFWQLHFAVAGGKENNVADPFIANPDENCQGQYLKLSANADGSFSVTNSRNKYSKTYAAR